MQTNNNSKTSSPWTAVFLLIVCMFVGADILLEVFTNNHPKKHSSDRLTSFFKSTQTPEVIVLGSSVALFNHGYADERAGFAPPGSKMDYGAAKYFSKVLSEKNGSPVATGTLANAGGMISDDYFVTEKLVEFNKIPKVIVYEMVSRDLFDASMPELGRTIAYESLAGIHPASSSKSMPAPVVAIVDWVKSTPVATALSLAFSDSKNFTDGERFKSTCDTIISSLSYSFKNRSNARQWLTEKTSAMLHRETSVYEAIRKNLEERKKKNPFASLQSECTGSIEVDSKPQIRRFDSEIVYLKRFLSICQKNGIQLVVIDMPVGGDYAGKVPPDLRGRYPKEIEALCAQYGATYFDCNKTKEFKKGDFSDFIHLNANGAIKCNQIIADELEKHRLIGSSGKTTH